MNAAARMFNQGMLSRGWVFTFLLSRIRKSMVILILAILTSALSIIYVTNASRELNASLQQTEAEHDHLHVQRGQLLLEKSTWMVQARVQQIAEDQLNMVIPDRQSIVVIDTGSR